MARSIDPGDWKPAGGISLEDVASDVVVSTESGSVIAGPGAGKTELLAQRALYLLQTWACPPPRRILAISFKRDAARNLKDRVARRCSADQARRFDSYTFDAFAKQLVDRFLALAPEWCRPPRNYVVDFTTRDEWRDFIQSAETPEALGGRFAAEAVDQSDVEGFAPLPMSKRAPKEIVAWLAWAWWRRRLAQHRPGLSFPMIGALARTLLMENPRLARALRLTYSHVFLDEFQDTTASQYELMKLAFKHSPAVLTAVGDTKQRIMTWAGAEAEVFDWFEGDFNASRSKLRMNHRSNRRIVQILNDLVTEIEPDAVETECARANDPVPSDAAAFWIFKTDDDEARYLAKFVAEDVEENEERSPGDFALIVRVRADQMEKQLRAAFETHGLVLRNEARLLKGVAIQDMMSDDLVALILGLMRLAHGVRSAEIYLPVAGAISDLLGVDPDNPADAKRLDDTLRRILGTVQDLTEKDPALTNFAVVVEGVVASIGKTAIRRLFRQYDSDKYMSDIVSALAALMAENVGENRGWSELLAAVLGEGQVRLMTIHKSKGLEYHTVIFVGLHENAFFGYRRNKGEETNNFFVALSRARERVYFTRSKESGATAQIKGLVDLLSKANVPIVER